MVLFFSELGLLVVDGFERALQSKETMKLGCSPGSIQVVYLLPPDVAPEVARLLTKNCLLTELMKHRAHDPRADGKKSLIRFLAPVIRFVREQAVVIAIHADLRVAHTSGSKSADGWKAKTTLNEVLVTTPQILLDSLQVCFVNLDLVDLLSFDECLSCTGTKFICENNERPLFQMPA